MLRCVNRLINLADMHSGSKYKHITLNVNGLSIPIKGTWLLKLGKPGVKFTFLATYTYVACVKTLATLSLSFLICKISIWPQRAVTKMK